MDNLPRTRAQAVRLLTQDAQNRMVRTFLVNAILDIATAVALAVTEALESAGNDVDWRIMWALVAKTVVASAGSFVLRRFGDPSRLPTPLPPTPQALPADPVDESDLRS